MNWIGKLQEAIDYIELNLLEDISIESVGQTIHYAPSSFQNLFSAVTGYSVMEYVRFRRLTCAADDLLLNRLSITEAAFKYKYETVEAFSKAFKRLYGVSPSQHSNANSILKFAPISIKFSLLGGFCMKRNLIPNLMRVDWSDTQRQNEFVNSVVSALNGIGEKLNYDYVCAVSGSAFRTSFSMRSSQEWNHGNYHAINAPIIIEHTFKMLGYKVAHHIHSDYEYDKKLIMDCIDKGVPVITLEGVINCSDACIISGYDNEGNVLLGYNPFMNINDDHNEAHDDTGYFRKSDWHICYNEQWNKVRYLIIDGKLDKPSKEVIFSETLKLIQRLIGEENLAPGQYNGLAAHKAFANALLTYEWTDNFEPYLNLMCNYKQYLDRQYAAKFFSENGRNDLAKLYDDITILCFELSKMIPQDFSAFDKFSDKNNLKPYVDTLLKICDLENEVIKLLQRTV